MYPTHDVDAQLLLATLIAAKRRPAELVELVAAAEFLGCPIKSASLWTAALKRAVSHVLIIADGGGFTLTPAAQSVVAGLPKKADSEERVFLVRERLARYEPAAPCAELTLAEEQFEDALRTHASHARQGGANLLMPKPKPEESAPPRRGGRRPYTGGSRR